MGAFEVRSMRAGEESALVDLLRSAYEGYSRAIWESVVERQTANAERSLVGVSDGQLVAAAYVGDYPMRIGGEVFGTAAVANVATHPEKRRRGYAQAVLREAVKRIRGWGYSLSILITPVPDYYRRFGYRAVEETRFRMRLESGNDGRADAFEIAPLDLVRHGDEVVAIHERISARLNGTTPRTRRVWDEESLWEPDDPARCLVAMQDGEVLGYIRGREGKARIVSEGAWECPQAGAALLAQLAADALAAGETVLRGNFPLEGAVVDVLRRHGWNVEVELTDVADGDFEIPMVAFPDLPGFFRQFEPVLVRRVREAGYEGDACITIACRAGEVTLASEGGRISTLSHPCKGAERITIEDSALVRLICGTESAAEAGLPERVSRHAETLLDILFAKRDFVLWLPDHFWAWVSDAAEKKPLTRRHT